MQHPDSSFFLTVNGERVEVAGALPTENLLSFLRRSGFTGSKLGCAEGDCGACSVVLVDEDAGGHAVYRTINSCIALLPSLAGREILTVEGIRSGAGLHPVQEALAEHYGSQCGYCTPGFTASLFEAYHRRECATPAAIADQLCGNLCRCTGYRSIREAACAVLAGRKEPVPQIDAGSRESGRRRFAYEEAGHCFYRPAALEELFALLKLHPEARLVAGATEIGVEINKLDRDPSILVSTEAVPELNLLHATEEAWEIGAACSLTKIEETAARDLPALAQMLRLFASRQIRNRATMGGNLATASPIGDCAPVLLALDAEVVLRSAEEVRTVPLDAFFSGYRKTVLKQGEILERIRIPRYPKGRQVFRKVSKRREMDISIVSAAFRIECATDGAVISARLAYGGVAAMPRRAYRAEAALLGRTMGDSLESVAAILKEEFEPIDDLRGSAEYRANLIVSLWERFVRLTDAETDEPPEFLNPASWPQPADASRSLRHESARGHVTGQARYVDDIAHRRPMLEMWPVLSPHAHARILGVETAEAGKAPGVIAVLRAADLPGINNVGPVRHDEPALAEGEVFYHGQVVAMVVANTLGAARKAAGLVRIDYEPLEPILGIEAAIRRQSFHTEPHCLTRGDTAAALTNAPSRLRGVFEFGGQEHFYLETHAAWAEPTDDGGIFVCSSTQHPTEIQAVVAEVLGLKRHRVVVEAPRMGGAFGGKETQGNLWAALAALAAWKTGQPVRVQLDRDVDMIVTGKRHPFRAEYEVGYDSTGMLLAARISLISDGGWSLDLSLPVNDRALFHLDNAYCIPAVDFSGRVAKTNVTSQTAFRGFGGPQGMLVIEEILGRIAQTLQLAPELVRRRNLYRGAGETNTTHYGAEIEDNRLALIWERLLVQAEFARRREEIHAWNRTHALVKRGLAITPVKFGISFTLKQYNQAGALVLLYTDGTAQVNHGGTEMGQGLHTKILGIAMRELGLPAESIRLMHTRTDKVPNTSATAASCGSDLNGAAVADACRALILRLTPPAAKLLGRVAGRTIPDDEVQWLEGMAVWKNDPAVSVRFADVTALAYAERVSLSATGYYKTPLIYWDWAVGKGRPFHYYAFGAAVSEVEVDGCTGMTRVRRVDILHDVGDSLNPGVDRGQIEGGFVQGLGWLTCEELLWDGQGKLATHSASTYAIPAIGDAPADFRVQLLDKAAQPRTVGGSKAVGEPPLMLAISVREAIRDAVAAALPPGEVVDLRSPATAEAIYRAMHPDRFESVCLS